MKLAELTSPEVDALDRDRTVVVIPTGSCEQHGAHLPLFTDSILATAVAEAAERKTAETTLLTPTHWQGASGHHLAFAGTLSNGFDAYIQGLLATVHSLKRHGFRKFLLVNGHGGNNDPNSIAVRTLKEADPNLVVGHVPYYGFAATKAADVLEGRFKFIRHACEAETSLMLHVRPDLVHLDRARYDGLQPEPAVEGMVHLFHEITEEGSLGDAPLGTAEKGRLIFEAAVEGLVTQLERLSAGYVLAEIESNPLG